MQFLVYITTSFYVLPDPGSNEYKFVNFEKGIAILLLFQHYTLSSSLQRGVNLTLQLSWSLKRYQLGESFQHAQQLEVLKMMSQGLKVLYVKLGTNLLKLCERVLNKTEIQLPDQKLIMQVSSTSLPSEFFFQVFFLTRV